MSDSLEAYVDSAMSTLPSRLLEFIVKHGGWAQALDYVDGLESLARQHREEVEAAEAALGEADEHRMMMDDLRLYGTAFSKNGKRIPPEDVYITQPPAPAVGEAMTLLSDIQADQSWRSNDNTLWPRIVAITRTSKETT